MHPPDQGPLGGIREDLKANGPGLIQWNLPLFDDEVLCKIVSSFSICRAFRLADLQLSLSARGGAGEPPPPQHRLGE